VLILLPPSEGKQAPRSGKPLELGTLALPELAPAREQVLAALTRLCAGDPGEASAVLGLSPGQAAEITRNARLATAPAAPAVKVYTGVLYEALGAATLPPGAARLARKSLLIFSALWGVAGLASRIPAYRCSAGISLPGLGAVNTFWRKALAGPLAEHAAGQLVIDLRSGPYAAMWKPAEPAPKQQPAVTVRVLHEREPGGARTVVSHFNKATKGRLVRDLLVAGAKPRTPAQLAEALRDLKYQVEADGANLDVIVSEL
jgi:cytoplasmic iron level regulating protein YaaA (DUF328/UPF0246 family)